MPIDLRRTTLVVRDIDDSLAFYRDALGLEVIYDNVIRTPRDAASDAEAERASRLVFLRANDDFVGIVGLLLGTLGGLFALGVLTKRPVAAHAWVGVVVSVVTLIYVKYYTDINGLAYAGIGVTTCLVAGWLASLTTPNWSKA